MEDRLKSIAGDNTVFKKRVSDQELADLYRNCRALLYPGIEDFGITPLEVAAAGRPTIALGRGGAIDTVIHESTGILYQNPQVAGLVDAILEYESKDWFVPEVATKHAQKFDNEAFRDRFIGKLLQHASHRLKPSIMDLKS